MRRAARLGDGWMPYLYSPERFERSVHEVRAYADEAQRDLSDFSWMSFVFVNVQDRAEDALADATAFLGATFKQDVGPFLDRVAAVGTPDQVGRRLRAFVDAGARHLLVAPATAGDPLSVARRVAAEIRPQFDHSGTIAQG
jgi:alkanesulfonate monooxygenase SsuD/methylene tetrahydromethanopterin reductase-like flavin-dependent oxidoreductase (luciferase family)